MADTPEPPGRRIPAGAERDRPLQGPAGALRYGVLGALALVGAGATIYLLGSRGLGPPAASPQGPDRFGPNRAPTAPGAGSPAAAAQSTSGSTRLQVSTSMPAHLQIDGRRVGSSPVAVDVAAGVHRVVAFHPGTGDTLREIEVLLRAGETKVIHVDLGGTEMVVDVGPWGWVAVDGRRLGRLPLDPLVLTEGRHEVVVRDEFDEKVERRVFGVLRDRPVTVIFRATRP